MTQPRRTPDLGLYQALMKVDRSQRLANQDRLRQLKRDQGANVSVFCSHDAKELEGL